MTERRVRGSLMCIIWSAVHCFSMGFAVSVLTLTGIVSQDGLDAAAIGVLVYAGASLAALISLAARHGLRTAVGRVTRPHARAMLAAALSNLLYVGFFWTAAIGVSPIAAAAAGPLRVPLEIVFGKLLLRGAAHRTNRRGSFTFLYDIGLAAPIVALSAYLAGDGLLETLLVQAALLTALVVSSAAAEVLRLSVSQPQSDGRGVDPALTILLNSLVAMLAFALWGIVDSGAAGLLAMLRFDRPWLFGGTLIVGASGVFLSQYAKSQAVRKGLEKQDAARLALTFAAASILATVIIEAATLNALLGCVVVPWADQTPIWLAEAPRQLEILVSFAVAFLVVAGIIRRR